MLFSRQSKSSARREPSHSFLWIEDVARLRRHIAELQSRQFDFDTFTSSMFAYPGRRYRFDACANLFAALEEEMHAFNESELKAYDHLFCGSHLDWVVRTLDPADGTALQQPHEEVRKDHRALRGTWKRQGEYFAKRQIKLPTLAQE